VLSVWPRPGGGAVRPGKKKKAEDGCGRVAAIVERRTGPAPAETEQAACSLFMISRTRRTPGWPAAGSRAERGVGLRWTRRRPSPSAALAELLSLASPRYRCVALWSRWTTWAERQPPRRWRGSVGHVQTWPVRPVAVDILPGRRPASIVYAGAAGRSPSWPDASGYAGAGRSLRVPQAGALCLSAYRRSTALALRSPLSRTLLLAHGRMANPFLSWPELVTLLPRAGGRLTQGRGPPLQLSVTVRCSGLVAHAGSFRLACCSAPGNANSVDRPNSAGVLAGTLSWWGDTGCPPRTLGLSAGFANSA